MVMMGDADGYGGSVSHFKIYNIAYAFARHPESTKISPPPSRAQTLLPYPPSALCTAHLFENVSRRTTVIWGVGRLHLSLVVCLCVSSIYLRVLCKCMYRFARASNVPSSQIEKRWTMSKRISDVVYIIYATGGLPAKLYKIFSPRRVVAPF